MTTKLRNKLTTSKEQVREAYLNGATLREIGDVHSVSAGTVRNVLIELGVELRPRGRRKKNGEDSKATLPVEELTQEEVTTVPDDEDPTPEIE